MKKTACLTAFPKCETIDPYFLNACPKLGATCVAGKCVVPTQQPTNIDCASAPQRIPGIEPPVSWTLETCTQNGLIWRETDSKCLKPIPKFPCKKNCDEITNMNKTVTPQGTFEAACPLISGLFYSKLVPLIRDSYDPYLIDQATKVLEEKGCLAPANNAELQVCATKLYTMNMLSLLTFAPNCTKTLTTAAGVTELYPEVDQTIAPLVQLNVNQAGGGNCEGCNEALAAVKGCGEVDPSVQTLSVQRGYAAIKEGSGNVCEPVIRDTYTNQDEQMIVALSTGLASVQATPAQQQKCDANLREDYRGLHFVSSYPGLGPLSPRLDVGNTEASIGNAECPIDVPTKFTNLQSPLCSFPDGTKLYNSKECLDYKIQSTWKAFPPFAPYKCRLAFRELLCTQGYTKVKLNTLCMVPDTTTGTVLPGCITGNNAEAAAADKIPFLFPIPRFPSRRMCTKYREECAPLIAPGSSLDFQCDAAIDIKECADPGLNDGIWGCSNPLNTLSQYPEATLRLADITQIQELNDYGTQTGLLTNMAQAFESQVVEPTISAPLYKDETKEILGEIQNEYCECPYPLVPPQDPEGLTLKPSTCCALPCLGSMHDDEDMETFGLLQLILSAIGVVCASFMCVTWFLFPEKHKQYMTFWLSFCSFNVSLAFLLMAAIPGGKTKETMCVDNTTPVLMEQGFSLCSMQGLWLMFFALAECGWWCCQSFDLFRKLVLGRRNTDEARLKYHLFCWTPPTIGAIILLSTQSFGYTPNNLYCLMDANASDLLEWLCFYVPVGLLFIAGTVMMFSVLAIIIRHTNRSGQLNQGTSSSGKFRQRYKMYRTPMLFVLMFIFVWLNIFAFRLLVLINTDTYTDQAVAWISCLTTNFWLNGIPNPATNSSADTSQLIGEFQYDAVGCGTKQPGGIPKGSLTLTFVVVMSQSILIFMVFGVQADNYRLWGEKFGCVDPIERTNMTNDTFTNSKNDSKFGGNQMMGPPGSSYYGSQSNYNEYSQGPPGGSMMGMGGGGMQPAGNSFYSVRAPDGMPPRPPPGLPPAPQSYGSYY